MVFNSKELQEKIIEINNLKEKLNKKQRELDEAKEKIDTQEKLINGYRKRNKEYQKIIIKKAVTLRKVLKDKNEETEEEEEI